MIRTTRGAADARPGAADRADARDPLATLDLQDGLGAAPIQRFADPALTADPSSLGPSGSGTALPDDTRAQMESSFGTSFSDVRVFEGEQAPSVGAIAYTRGSNVHFAPGRYDPSSQSGKSLLGHELAHVVQQREGRVSRPQAKGAPVNADAGLEAEADRAGARAAAGLAVSMPGAGRAEAASASEGEVSQPKLDDSAGGPKSGGVIQRAIGFEFEFGQWKTRHANDHSPLAKGEEIVRGAGFKIEGEDGSDGSAIEVVTMPFAGPQEAIASVSTAEEILQGMARTPGTADAFGGDANVEVEPHGAAGKFQASPAVGLDKMGDLFKQGVGASYSGFAEMVHGALNDKKTRKRFLDGNKPSPELEGLVMLVVNYLEQGANSFALNYPKSAFKVMARTSFDKMFSMVPEHEFFGLPENREKWVGLVMSVAARIPSIGKEVSRTEFETDWRGKPKMNGNGVIKMKERKRTDREMRDAPVLGMDLMGMDNLPEDSGEDQQRYRSTVTREDWLRQMPERDLLSKANDKRFEGMGAYGGATDRELTPSELEQVGEDVGQRVGAQLDAPQPTQEPLGDNPVDLPAQKEAPLFELRGLRDMFGVDQDIGLSGWGDKVREVFDIVDKANADKDKRGNVTRTVRYGAQGKPNIAPDVDNPGIWERR